MGCRWRCSMESSGHIIAKRRGSPAATDRVGEDVTPNVRTDPLDLPLRCPLSDAKTREKAGLPQDFEVRGEVIMPDEIV